MKGHHLVVGTTGSKRSCDAAARMAETGDEASALARELDVATRALDAGDARHALAHLAGAIALAPSDARVQALFEAIAGRGDVLAILPDGPFYGTQAVRALAHHQAGDVDAAVSLLAQVTEVAPQRGFERTLARWIAGQATRGLTLGEAASRQVARLLAAVGGSTVGLHRLHEGERALLSGYAEVASALAAAGASDSSAPIASAMLRRAGKSDQRPALTHCRQQTGHEIVQPDGRRRVSAPYTVGAQHRVLPRGPEREDELPLARLGRCPPSLVEAPGLLRPPRS